MSENRVTKKVVIDVSEIEILKTRDGRFFAPDPLEGLAQIRAEESGAAESAALFLESSDRRNSPGGVNFEAAKKLLESYRILTLVSGSGQKTDRFDLPAQDEDPKVPEISAFSADPAADPAALVLHLDSCLEAMLDSSSDEILDAGELLYARYVKPEYASKQTGFYMALFKCSRATWFRLLNRATGILSRLMFGL